MTEENINDSEDKTTEIAQSKKKKKKNQSGSGKEPVQHSDGCGHPLRARY